MQLKSSVLSLLALVSLAAANPMHLAGYGEVNLDGLDVVRQGVDPMTYDTESTGQSTSANDEFHHRRGPVTIVSVKAANKCLDVRGAAFTNGTPVQIFDCNATSAQKFVFHHGSGHIRVSGTNFCLDANYTPRSGQGLKIWTCLNVPQQRWRYRGDRSIKLRTTNLCVDLSRGSLDNGSQAQTFTCVRNEHNQIWRLRA